MATNSGNDPTLPPSSDDLRRLEERFTAWVQEIDERLVLLDGRFASAGGRIHQVERRTDAVAAHADSRLRDVDRLFDSIENHVAVTDARVVDTRDQILDRLQEGRTAMFRTTATGVILSLVVSVLTFVAILHLR